MIKNHDNKKQNNKSVIENSKTFAYILKVHKRAEELKFKSDEKLNLVILASCCEFLSELCEEKKITINEVTEDVLVEYIYNQKINKK